MRIPEYVSELIDRLEGAGESTYIVGGSLRDALLGKNPYDYDVATSALPEKTKAIFADMRVIETGIKHGTVTVISDSHPVEITTFRIDGSYTDSRHPDKVAFTDKISEDLSRRDFTVNAMAYSPKRGFVDVFGGKDDLGAGIIRAVRDPYERFSEDALRILRAFRFSSQLGFEICEETLRACGECKAGISELSAERVCSELLRLLSGESPVRPLRQMSELGILPLVMRGYSPSDKLISLVDKMPPDSSARLGFLLSEADSEQVSAVLSALKCSNKQKTAALAVVRGSRFGVSSRAEAGRLVALSGVYSQWAVAASVLLGVSPKEAEEWVKGSKAPSSISQLAVSGRDIMALGAQGKRIGEVLSALFELAVADPDLNDREKLLHLAKQMTDNS